MLAHLQTTINAMTLKDFDDSRMDPATTITTGHCVTATVHERKSYNLSKTSDVMTIFFLTAHGSHTLRTCLTRTVASNNTQSLCELIHDIVDPMNWYGGEFTCRACNNTHRCNDHTLQIGDGLGSGSSTMVASCLLVVAAMVSIHNLI